ncbi:unnamed protein product [Pieris brassicae]|uniref:deoxyribose-phosphate aldolase n=1 Tax=Pieris brassicae TaxID=7116 RepID=A0A9P0TC30_PIEBR|nr:unnamed protein product [Pieris brassicae]
MTTSKSREFNFTEVNSILIDVYLNKNSIEAQVNRILEHNLVFENKNYQQWLLKAVSVLDLTTLSGDDTRSNVRRLCIKADRPLSELNINIKTAAVCVYPSRVSDASDTINRMQKQDVKIASVATGFPSGLYDIETRTLEIKYAVSCGAHEIDVVIDRTLVLTGQWLKLYNELKQMKEACKDAHMKVILGVGELGSYENVYRASIVSILAGANFIKTSTGKEAVNATLPVGLVMCRAIKRCYQDYNIKVGLKPAGGIKTARDAVNWLILVQSELGPEWVTPEYFRIGASSLLDEIKKELKLLSTNY